MNINEQFGKFIGDSEVRLVRTLPGPIERVWEYLTDSKKRSLWLAGGELEQKAGGKVDFVMKHKNLAPDETPPAEYAHVQDPGVTFSGRVLRCEPPRLLAYTFGSDDSEVTFELTAKGKDVILVLTHRTRGEEERAELSSYATGWHIHLAQLVAQLEEKPRPPFWAEHSKLLPQYQDLRATVSST